MPARDETRTGRLHIGDVATRVGLSLRTIRYYEEVGLLTPTRTEGGHRLYDDADIARLTLIKSTKALGLTLEEMGRLVQLVEDSVDPGQLSAPTLATVVTGLREFVERSDAAISRHERELTQARELRQCISEQLRRCEEESTTQDP